MEEQKYTYKEAKTSFGLIDKRQHELVTHNEFNKYINEFNTQGNHQDDALVELYGAANNHHNRLVKAEQTLVEHTEQLTDHEDRIGSAEQTLVQHDNRITTNTQKNNAQDEVLVSLDRRLAVVEDETADFKVVTVFANNLQKTQHYVANPGQQTFTLDTSYIPGQNRLQIFVDGVQQIRGVHWVEINSNQFQFTEALYEGANVSAHWFTEDASDDLTEIMETIKEGPAILDGLIAKGEQLKADSILVQDTEPLPSDNCDIWFDTSEDDDTTLDKWDITSVEGHILAREIEQTNAQLSDVTYTSLNHDKYYRYSYVQPLILLGDSITEGANATDLVNYSWAGLINLAYQKKYNVRNQGFVNFNTYTVEGDKYHCYHRITRNGFSTHANPFDDTMFGGSRITSVRKDDYVDIVYTGKNARLVYMQDDTGALIEVKVDNSVVGVIDTKELKGIKNGSISTEISVSEWGSHTIRLTNQDGGTAQILGMIYNENDTKFTPSVYNVGRSSIALSDIPNELLTHYACYGTIVFSLGVNDQLLNKDINIFKNKLDLVFSEIKRVGGDCLINDFMFSLPQDNEYKIALKEYGKKYNFEVLDYQILWGGTVDSNKFIKYLDTDGVHPTVEGHEFIYNVIANRLSLPYTVNDLIGRLKPILVTQFLNNWVNFVTDTSHKQAKFYIDSDGIVHGEGMIKGGTTTAYTDMLTLPYEFKPKSDMYFSVATDTGVGVININREGTVRIVSGGNGWLSLNGVSYLK